MGDIAISVTKRLETVDDTGPEPLIQTATYSYNASIRDQHSLFRVDNQHVHDGHADSHHLHSYDWRTGEQLPGSPEFVGIENWMTLGEFIGYVSDWYYEHRAELPNPDAYATPQPPSIRLAMGFQLPP